MILEPVLKKYRLAPKPCTSCLQGTSFNGWIHVTEHSRQCRKHRFSKTCCLEWQSGNQIHNNVYLDSSLYALQPFVSELDSSKNFVTEHVRFCSLNSGTCLWGTVPNESKRLCRQSEALVNNSVQESPFVLFSPCFVKRYFRTGENAYGSSVLGVCLVQLELEPTYRMPTAGTWVSMTKCI